MLDMSFFKLEVKWRRTKGFKMRKQPAEAQGASAWSKSVTELSFSEEKQLLMNIHEVRQLASCLFAFLNELETPESIMSDTPGESTNSKESRTFFIDFAREVQS